MPDGSSITLTYSSGKNEAISLQSIPWRYIDYSIDNVELVYGENKTPLALRNMSGQLIKHDKVFSLLLKKDINNLILNERPVMIPNPDSLDLSYSIDGECPKKMEYWKMEGK